MTPKDENGETIEVFMQVEYEGDTFTVESINGDNLTLHDLDDDTRIEAKDFEVQIV